MTIFGFVFLSLLIYFVNSLNDDPSLIRINDGLIQGQIFDDIIMWRSIPYAQAPINELRWSHTEPPIPWGNNTKMTNYDPPGCPQACDLPPLTCPTVTSEDCLFLNVFKPMTAPDDEDGYSVMVFYHGGNFFQGYSGGLLYNGTNIVKLSNIILVTVNYRLGALGFLWSATGPNGNYGMYDQIQSLHWVQDNIKYFGGNPNKVTIFGQSAGAVSVAILMAYQSPNNLNLFQGAIMESEPFGLPIRDTVTWGTLPRKFYEYLGCDYDRLSRNESAFWDCLRGKTAQEIVDAQVKAQNNPLDEVDHFWDIFLPWTPTAGTDLISKQVFWEFQSGNYVDVPYIIGSVRDEGFLFVMEAFPDPIGYLELVALFDILVGESDKEAIFKEYPPPKNTTDYRMYGAEVVTYGLFWCPTWNVTLGGFNNNIKSDHWLYHFNRVSSFNPNVWGPEFAYCDPLVCHGSDLPYVFHPNLAPDNTTYNPEEVTLALQMQSFWSNFSKNFNPGTSYIDYTLSWPKFESESQSTMLFDVPKSSIANKFDTINCEFWNSLNYNWIK